MLSDQIELKSYNNKHNKLIVNVEWDDENDTVEWPNLPDDLKAQMLKLQFPARYQKENTFKCLQKAVEEYQIKLEFTNFKNSSTIASEVLEASKFENENLARYYLNPV